MKNLRYIGTSPIVVTSYGVVWPNSTVTVDENAPEISANPTLFVQPEDTRDVTFSSGLNPSPAQQAQARANIGVTSADIGPTFRGMSDGLSRDLVIISDSTSNDPTEWGYLLGQKLATAFPAYSVKVALFNAATSSYNPPFTLQTGSSGERYIASTGATTATATLPVAYVATPTTGIDIQVDMQPVSWSSGAIQTILAQLGGAGARGTRFLITPTGYLALNYSPDGTNFPQINCTVPTGFTAGSRHWVRATLLPDNGSSGFTVSFYSSTNGTTWTAMGTPVITAGVTTIFNNTTTNWELFGRQTGVDPMAGKIFAVRCCDGVGGPNRFPPQIDLWQSVNNADGSIISLGGSPEITILNAGISGASLTTWSDSTLLEKAIINRDTTRILVSLGHNQGYNCNYGSTQTYTNLLNTFVTAVQGRAASAELIFMSQNPRIAPANYIRAHAIRRDQLWGWCKTKGWKYVDVYRAFQESKTPLALLVNNTDGIHPVAAGSSIWADAVYKEIIAAP